MEIINQDCLLAMDQMEAATVDAIITDPPYCSGGFTESERSGSKSQGKRSGIPRDWFRSDNMGTAGLVWMLRLLALQARRIMKPSGSLLIFCDWRQVSNIQPALESAGLRYQNMIVWDKGSAGLGRGFRCQHELILHFTCGRAEYFNRSTGNVLTCPRPSREATIHQTQKPIEILEWMIQVVAPPGGVILDPFCGSGSTGVAAIRTGRDFIGIEVDPNMAEAARQRLTGGTPLFPEGEL